MPTRTSSSATILSVALATACGGSSTGASEPSPSGDALASMAFVDAVAGHRAELCDRFLAIVGPPVERSCPDGSTERRGAAECSGEHELPSPPADCPATVAEVEGCFRAIAAVPECGGISAMLAAATGPECAVLGACRAPRSEPEPAAYVPGGPLTHAALDEMMSVVVAAYPDQTFEVTFAQLSERYGSPQASPADGTHEWRALEGETCWVFTLTDPSDATYAAGSVLDEAASRCSP